MTSRLIVLPSRLLWPAIALLTLAAAQPQASASEPVAEPHEQYRVLAWTDLVPDGWEPPLVSRAYDEVSETNIDQASVVEELDGQLAALPGYMKPIVFEDNRVTEFLLVPFLPHQTRAHAHLEANQMVYVRVLEPVVVEQPLEPIWIVGTLNLEAVMTDEGPAAYSMIEAVTTPYEY